MHSRIKARHINHNEDKNDNEKKSTEAEKVIRL